MYTYYSHRAMIEQNQTVENENKDTEPNNNSSIVIIPKEKEEAKSKRINLLIRPSTLKKVLKKCKELNISLNECINQFLESWIK